MSVPHNSIEMVRTPHKHAAVIKAWADGAEIEYRYLPRDEWRSCKHAPAWCSSTEYRVKPEPHKWQAVMDAYFQEDKDIQIRYADRSIYSDPWVTWPGTETEYKVKNYRFDDNRFEFRIKPEPVVLFDYVHPDDLGKPRSASTVKRDGDNVEYTFEDGKLISAKVL